MRVWKRRHLILVAGLIGGTLAFLAGWKLFQTKYTAQVLLMRREMANAFQATKTGESFKPRQFSAATVSAMMGSIRLMEETGVKLRPTVSPQEMQRRLVIKPDKNTDLIAIAYTSGDSPDHVVEAVNLFAQNVVDLTREMQSEEASELLRFIDDQLVNISQELGKVQQEQLAFSKESGLHDPVKETESYIQQSNNVDLKIETARIELATLDFRLQQLENELAKQDPTMQRLHEQRDKLSEMLSQYMPEHPAVVEQKAKVAALEAQISKHTVSSPESYQMGDNKMANGFYVELVSLRSQKESLTTEIKKLEEYNKQLGVKLDAMPDKSIQQGRLAAQAASLQEAQALLEGRQREAKLFADRSLGYYRLFAPATVDSVEISSRTKKTVILSVLAALGSMVLVAGWRAFCAVMDDRIISPSDLRRVVKAPVIASMGDGVQMEDGELKRWRFQTWAKLLRQVEPPQNAAFVVGLISAEDGEGKTFWLQQLGRAAIERGLKVLAVSRVDEEQVPEGMLSLDLAFREPVKVLEHLRSPGVVAVEFAVPGQQGWRGRTGDLWKRALEIWSAEPGLVILVEAPPAGEIEALLLAESLPYLLWVSESGRNRRPAMTDVLHTMRESGLQVDGAFLSRMPAIFAKLPDLAKFGLCLALTLALCHSPARAQDSSFEPPLTPSQQEDDMPLAAPAGNGALAALSPSEAMPRSRIALAGSVMPILTGGDLAPLAPGDATPGPPKTSGGIAPPTPPNGNMTPLSPSDAASDSGQDTIEPQQQPPPMGDLAPLAPAAASPSAGRSDDSSEPLIRPPEMLPADENSPSVPNPNSTAGDGEFRPQLAPWQERLELGPGDMVNLQIYGHKQYTRTLIPVGPDGTIDYLQVHGFKATGLTIDELREGLTKELRVYIRNVQVIVTPGAWRSKKYFMMGTIQDRGAYTLDRPMSLLEAAARARGIATGLMDHNTVEIADMKRAFIVREGKKLPVDFSKLFSHGDLSQNIQLYPGDYIYFPGNGSNEVYVLGEVQSPGYMGISENLTSVGAITVRGGFTKAAWRQRVLVVRGSLDKPTAIPVNVAAILAGRQKDIVLQPRDLIYVSERPWKRAEDLVDTAVKAFLQAGVATWTGQNVNLSTH